MARVIPQMNDQDLNVAFLKLAVIWVGTLFGGLTLSGLVLSLTAIYTCLQIYILVRDKICRRPPE